MRKWIVVSVLIALVGLVVPSASAQSGQFSKLLSLVPAEPRSLIWYSSLGDLGRILGVKVASRAAIDTLPSQQRLTYLFELGQQVYYSVFSGMERSDDWNQAFKVNSFAIDREVTFGGDDPVGIMLGQFNAGDINGALGKLGYLPIQVGNTPILGLGADYSNDPSNLAQQIAGAYFNRVAVSNTQIVAAQSTGAISQVLQGGPKITANGAYAALAATLETPNAVPGSILLSAALLDGDYLRQKVFVGDPLSGVGLSADQLGLQNPLPAYVVAGLGYQRSAQARALQVALVYADANAANQAGAVLVDRLKKYRSLSAPERPVFEGWIFTTKVAKVGNFSVLVAQAQMPAQTDVVWVQMVRDRDVWFLK